MAWRDHIIYSQSLKVAQNKTSRWPWLLGQFTNMATSKKGKEGTANCQLYVRGTFVWNLTKNNPLMGGFTRDSHCAECSHISTDHSCIKKSKQGWSLSQLYRSSVFFFFLGSASYPLGILISISCWWCIVNTVCKHSHCQSLSAPLTWNKIGTWWCDSTLMDEATTLHTLFNTQHLQKHLFGYNLGLFYINTLNERMTGLMDIFLPVWLNSSAELDMIFAVQILVDTLQLTLLFKAVLIGSFCCSLSAVLWSVLILCCKPKRYSTS